MIKKWHQLWRTMRARKGTILPLYAMSFAILFVVGGAGADMARHYLVREKVMNAADRAMLAASSVAGGVAPANMVTAVSPMAQSIFHANFPDRFMGVERPLLTITYDDTEKTLSGEVAFAVPMMFMNVFQVNELNDKVQSTFRLNLFSSLEVALVIDISGSMSLGTSTNKTQQDATRCTVAFNTDTFLFFGLSGSAFTPSNCYDPNNPTGGGTRLAAVQRSAKGFVSDLLGSATPDQVANRAIKMGLVAFSDIVTFSTTQAEKFRTLSGYSKDSADSHLFETNCFWARPRPDPQIRTSEPTNFELLLDVNDVPLSSSNPIYPIMTNPAALYSNRYPFGGSAINLLIPNSPYLWRCLERVGVPNVAATYQFNPSPMHHAVVPLTNDKMVLDAAIDELVSGGFTVMSEGAAWGLRVLSPRWRNHWVGLRSNEPGQNPTWYAGNTPPSGEQTLKVLIIFTDGNATIPNTDFGALYPVMDITQTNAHTYATTPGPATDPTPTTYNTFNFTNTPANLRTDIITALQGNGLTADGSNAKLNASDLGFGKKLTYFWQIGAASQGRFKIQYESVTPYGFLLGQGCYGYLSSGKGVNYFSYNRIIKKHCFNKGGTSFDSIYRRFGYVEAGTSDANCDIANARHRFDHKCMIEALDFMSASTNRSTGANSDVVDNGSSSNEVKNRTLDVCKYAISKGVLVYTIGFQGTHLDGCVDELERITGGKHNYLVNNEAQLKQAFKDILAQLTTPRFVGQ